MADNLPLARPIETQLLDDQADQLIKEAIITFRLKPGQPLVESRLAQDFGISKTPIREALLRLELDGLVVRIPYTGTYVSDISLEDIRDIFEVRAALEGLAVRLAVPLLSKKDLNKARAIIAASEDALIGEDVKRCAEEGRRFHDVFQSKVKNRYLLETLRRLDDHIERGRMVTVRVPASYRRSIEEHKVILAAAERGDAIQAEQATKEHIASVVHELQVNLAKIV